MHSTISGIALRSATYLVLMAGVLFYPAAGQTSAESNDKPLPTADEQVTLRSPITGTDYSLTVYLPASYTDGQSAYPVLYALDGDASFDELTARAASESGGAEMIVVGIGYGLDPDDRRPLRLRDYTHAPVPGLDGSGGAGDFIRFMETTLVPTVAERYRTDPAHRILAGHSLGGFFVLYAMFANVSLFDGYIVISPSVAVDDYSELRSEFEYTSDEAAHLAVAVGGNEDPDRMITPVERFVDSMQSDPLKGIQLTTAFIEGEDHFSVVDPALRWALQEVSVK